MRQVSWNLSQETKKTFHLFTNSPLQKKNVNLRTPSFYVLSLREVTLSKRKLPFSKYWKTIISPKRIILQINEIEGKWIGQKTKFFERKSQSSMGQRLAIWELLWLISMNFSKWNFPGIVSPASRNVIYPCGWPSCWAQSVGFSGMRLHDDAALQPCSAADTMTVRPKYRRRKGHCDGEGVQFSTISAFTFIKPVQGWTLLLIQPLFSPNFMQTFPPQPYTQFVPFLAQKQNSLGNWRCLILIYLIPLLCWEIFY